MPTSEASAFHCKYKIEAASELSSNTDPKLKGYIFIQIEQYGFDEEVHIIVQPRGKFVDYDSSKN